MNLNKFSGGRQCSRQRPVRAKGGNERRDHDQTGIGEQRRHLADPADIFDPLLS